MDKNSENYEFLSNIMEDLSIRGTHSYGICYYDSKIGEYMILKSFKQDFDMFLETFYESSANGFIYHNRYSTSGDWKNMNNNQPILVDGVGAIAMNGVLSMKTKSGFEREFGVKCSCDNDSEVFLRKIESGKDVVDFLYSYRYCSFAGLFLINNIIYAVRNNERPLYKYSDGRNSFFVSSLDTLVRSAIIEKSELLRNTVYLYPMKKYYI